MMQPSGWTTRHAAVLAERNRTTGGSYGCSYGPARSPSRRYRIPSILATRCQAPLGRSTRNFSMETPSPYHFRTACAASVVRRVASRTSPRFLRKYRSHLRRIVPVTSWTTRKSSGRTVSRPVPCSRNDASSPRITIDVDATSRAPRSCRALSTRFAERFLATGFARRPCRSHSASAVRGCAESSLPCRAQLGHVKTRYFGSPLSAMVQPEVGSEGPYDAPNR